MDQKSFEQYEALCSAVFGNVGTGNTPEAREMLESICLQPNFVEKAETVFENSKNIYALHCAGTSLTQIMTEYWNNYDVDQKKRIQYLINNGSQLPFHITSTLCTLICRITSLSWMTDPRQRDILDLMLNYTKSREHCISALAILDELVSQMNPTKRSTTQQNKAAIQFRDSNLYSIIGLAFNLLHQTYEADDATVGSVKLRYDLYEASLKLLIRCFGFDCKLSRSEGMEEYSSLSIPGDWLSSIMTVDNINMLFTIYYHVDPPITTLILECIVWQLSAPRSEISAISMDTGILEVILQQLINLLGDGHGLNDLDTVHEMCQLIDRFKAVNSIRTITDSSFQQLISRITPFTQTLLLNIYDYSNSLTYLFHFWFRLCQDTSRLVSEPYMPLHEFLKTQLEIVIQDYINKRLNDVPDWLNDIDDDGLIEIEKINSQLTCLGGMIRFKYADNVKLICSIYDGLNKEYTNESRMLNTMKLSGNINNDLIMKIRCLECKLAWLVNIIAYTLLGEKFTSNQNQNEEEVFDAELCKRVFALSHSISYRMNNANALHCDARLELALINFFTIFRTVFSLFTPHNLTDILMPPIFVTSGNKEAACNHFFDRMGIGDFSTVMNAIVEKICGNLRYWEDNTMVIEASLNLFLEMSQGYQGCKLLLQLESVDFMLQNHTEDTFHFLSNPYLLSYRTRYYSSLTRLILMDNVPGRLELFVSPFLSLLQKLAMENLAASNMMVPIMKLFKDLRGVFESCSDKRSYNIVFETLSSSLFQVMLHTIDAYSSNSDLIAALFKCLQAMVDNHECRVDSGSTSTNGIQLFKNTSSIICSYTQHLLNDNTNFNTAPEDIFRCARLLLQVMNLALTGKYIPFGVFSLYNDSCLRDSLEACMNIVLQMPFYQVEKRQKLEKVAFTFIDILFMNHIDILSQMASEGFINLVRFVVVGLDSYDEETVARCSDCIDQFATYYYLNRNRDVETVHALQRIVNANNTIWNDLFEKILNSLLFNKKSEEVLSRPIQSIYLIDSGVAANYYKVISSTQPQDVVMKLKESMVNLTKGMDITLEPILRDQFCVKCREFRNEVLSYLVL